MAAPGPLRRYGNPNFIPTADPQRAGTPRPGNGTVWVHRTNAGERTRRAVWNAEWIDPYQQPNAAGEEYGYEAIESDNKVQVLAWARSRPAVDRQMITPTGWITLPDNDDDVDIAEPAGLDRQPPNHRS
jgi:hypothetical protein